MYVVFEHVVFPVDMRDVGPGDGGRCHQFRGQLREHSLRSLVRNISRSLLRRLTLWCCVFDSCQLYHVIGTDFEVFLVVVVTFIVYKKIKNKTDRELIGRHFHYTAIDLQCLTMSER